MAGFVGFPVKQWLVPTKRGPGKNIKELKTLSMMCTGNKGEPVCPSPVEKPL